jgi:uncharacterized protein YyaL (SSP411 family)
LLVYKFVFMQEQPNALIHESSPYLLQHAYNPVEWLPWGEKALQLAKALDKPILVSIGYSACHWCHVMERESFEDKDLASMMNEYLVCIKVDREERPDVDGVYMDALQAMGLQGGWPLNVFLTPDQKPFYGGTYFPPAQWAQVLRGINRAWRDKREDILKSAEGITGHLQQSELKKYGLSVQKRHFDPDFYRRLMKGLSGKFDKELGGMQRAPKFPMPCIWNFTTQYLQIQPHEEAREQLELTLDEMAYGGIYDQIGGGFARYSVDGEWHVPHFEKMLYDNGQLLSLYARGYALLSKPLYKRVVNDTIAWLSREMRHEEGGLYAALDADSEGVEGKFYVWSLEEIKAIFEPEEAARVAEFYDVRPSGNWEGHNILRKLIPDEVFARKQGWSPEAFVSWQKKINRQLLDARAVRIRPGLDDKRLAGWNGLAMSGLAHAALYMQHSGARELLEEVTRFTLKNFIRNGELHRTLKNGVPAIPGFLEDYAACIQGLLDAYQVMQEEQLLAAAAQLCERAIALFWDDKEGFFYLNAAGSGELIARKKELFDNVIPSGNSIMAHNLFQLGLVMNRPEWQEKAQKMMGAIMPLLQQEVQFLANWAYVLGEMSFPVVEVAIVGPDAPALAGSILRKVPTRVLAFGTEDAQKSGLVLFQGRKALQGKTTWYVCVDKACQLPVQSEEEALALIRDILHGA